MQSKYNSKFKYKSSGGFGWHYAKLKKNTTTDFYQLLQISNDEKKLTADQDKWKNIVNKKFRELALQFHPDHSGDDGKKFVELQRARETLSDPLKRKKYDQSCVGEVNGKFDETITFEAATLLLINFFKLFFAKRGNGNVIHSYNIQQRDSNQAKGIFTRAEVAWHVINIEVEYINGSNEGTIANGLFAAWHFLEDQLVEYKNLGALSSSLSTYEHQDGSRPKIKVDLFLNNALLLQSMMEKLTQEDPCFLLNNIIQDKLTLDKDNQAAKIAKNIFHLSKSFDDITKANILYQVKLALKNPTDKHIYNIRRLLRYLSSEKPAIWQSVKDPLNEFFSVISLNPVTDPNETNAFYALPALIRDTLRSHPNDALTLTAKNIMNKLIQANISSEDLTYSSGYFTSGISSAMYNVLVKPTQENLDSLKYCESILINSKSTVAKKILGAFITFVSLAMLAVGLFLTLTGVGTLPGVTITLTSTASLILGVSMLGLGIAGTAYGSRKIHHAPKADIKIHMAMFYKQAKERVEAAPSSNPINSRLGYC